MESSLEFDISLTIDKETGQRVVPSIREETRRIDYLDEGIHLFRGVFFGILFAIPIWISILWIILYPGKKDIRLSD
jgi:hypothetical protein